jgi:2-amino-4-hydroxy-6-hydroxymethyldihydropteridine diphosphokinase
VAQAFLGLGANLGDPAAQIEAALARLDAHNDIAVVARSRMIVTRAWGRTDQPDFTNMVAAVATGLPPQALLEACLDVEQAMGRVRREVWGPRIIDIDIIAYGKLVLRSGRLTLPHPHAHRRQFVLGPLREIAPDVADWVVGQANAPRVDP